MSNLVVGTFELSRTFPFGLDRLDGVEQTVPVHRGFIPLQVFEYDFPDKEKAQFRAQGVGSVSMALTVTNPFGFTPEVNSLGTIGRKTQQTAGIILTSGPHTPEKWSATLRTPDALTDFDKEWFDFGLHYFAKYIMGKLNRSA